MKTTHLEHLKNYKKSHSDKHLIIAIDPDTIKSGLTELYTKDRSLFCYSLTFPMLIEFLQNYKKKEESGINLIVVVEAGYLIQKSNWHKGYFNKKLNKHVTNSEAVNESNAKKTGRNHQVAKLIVEMCHHYGIEVVEQRPLKKIWNGPEGKITHDELSQFVHNLPKQTNQEVRDSVLLAWNYASYPIRLNSKINGKEKK